MRKNESLVDDPAPNVRPMENEVDSSPLPPEGVRLVQAFVRITTPDLRDAVLRLVEDLARIDQVGRSGTR